VDNKEFGRKLEKRTREFAVRIIRLSVKLPNTPEGRVIRNQLTKAGTSIGANYREANRARSKADFRNKISICESEASETQYWLEIIRDMNWISQDYLEPEW
jgi:four helix bundle protein